MGVKIQTTMRGIYQGELIDRSVSILSHRDLLLMGRLVRKLLIGLICRIHVRIKSILGLPTAVPFPAFWRNEFFPVRIKVTMTSNRQAVPITTVHDFSSRLNIIRKHALSIWNLNPLIKGYLILIYLKCSPS